MQYKFNSTERVTQNCLSVILYFILKASLLYIFLSAQDCKVSSSSVKIKWTHIYLCMTLRVPFKKLYFNIYKY